MAKCYHPKTRALGTRIHFGAPCAFTGVPAGRYFVNECRTCKARIDTCEVTLDRYVYTREALTNGRVRPETVKRDPEVYVPQHDGVDAFEDTRIPPPALFNTRGGSGGVGDVEDVAAGTDWGVPC